MNAEFPVLWPSKSIETAACKAAGCPRSIPWEWVAPHEAQAKRNHSDQSLARLAERGGLSPAELLAVLTDRHWSTLGGITDVEALPELMALVAALRGTRSVSGEGRATT